jgi:hypothetical protein
MGARSAATSASTTSIERPASGGVGRTHAITSFKTGADLGETVLLQKLDESDHSISSSARMRRDSGTSSFSSFATFKLTMSSNLAGSSTGRSAGLVPLRTRST